MKFNQNSHEIFRKWYVDGRIYFHKVVDSKQIQKVWSILEMLVESKLKIVM